MTSTDLIIKLATRLERDRFLNTWLREFQPELLKSFRSGEFVEINAGNQKIIAKCDRFSPSGFHRFEDDVIVQDENGSRAVNSISDLAGILLASQTKMAGSQINKILHRIEGSSAASIAHAVSQASRTPGVSPVELEQSLWFGHPFHPLAKNVAGFSPADTKAYAPERAARFQLRWLLVNQDDVAEFKGDAERVAEMDLRLAEASGLSARNLQGKILFPCHPWQATRLNAIPEFAGKFKSGAFRLTEARGDYAIPTSSVRTVWFPEKNLFVKLPIEATITNFSRVNTSEQIARSIAGAEAVIIAGSAVKDADLTVLDEPVGRILKTTDIAGKDRYHPETGYLLRDAGFGSEKSLFTVAGLLEINPVSGKAHLATICGSRLQGSDNVRRWLRAYIQVSLMPLLRLFNDTGIALEAHSQNSLVQFVDGWPERLFVRDLEGIAVVSDNFEKRFGDHVNLLDKALFYDRETAWRRLLYYVVVNHFFHIVASLAEVSDVEEIVLWETTTEVLMQLSRIKAVEALFATEELPAKANLKSCLGGHSDTPSYIPIPNPLHVEGLTQRFDAHQSNLTEAPL